MSNEFRTMSFRAGADFGALVGMEGSTQGAVTPVIFPDYEQHYFLPAGATTITKAMLGRFAPILCCVNPAGSSLTLPTLSSMSVTVPSDGTRQPTFRIRLIGAGNLALNPNSGVRIIYNGFADPTVWTRQNLEGSYKYSPIFIFTYCGTDPDFSDAETWVA